MYYFIVNPVAGGKRANKVFNKLKARLESEKIDYKYDYTETSGHATELAKKAALSGDLTVVCVGGDGTVAAVGYTASGSALKARTVCLTGSAVYTTTEAALIPLAPGGGITQEAEAAFHRILSGYLLSMRVAYPE